MRPNPISLLLLCTVYSMPIRNIDPLDAIPAVREYECPDCGEPLTHQGTQQGSIPLSADGSDRGAGRYALYACQNHADYGMSRDEEPGEKCYNAVTVFESGIVGLGEDRIDRQETLDQFVRGQSNGEITLEDVLESLRV